MHCKHFAHYLPDEYRAYAVVFGDEGQRYEAESPVTPERDSGQALVEALTIASLMEQLDRTGYGPNRLAA